MNRTDEEFEVFLRQFRPRPPRPLPTPRRTVLLAAAAVVILAALVLPVRLWRDSPAPNSGSDQPALPSSAPANPAEIGGDQRTSPSSFGVRRGVDPGATTRPVPPRGCL
jgi:hypothetical protein